MSRNRSRKAGAAAVLALMWVTTACGTTVSNADVAAGGAAGSQPGVLDAGSGGELDAPGGGPTGSDVVGADPLAQGATAGGAPGDAPGSAPGSAGSSGSGEVPAGAPGAQAPDGSSQPGARPNAPGGAATGLGVTASTITIGALTANNAGNYQKALGFEKGATGDQIAMTESVVKWLNKNGGIGGRQVKVVFYDMKPEAAAADPSSAYEAACTHFTQDNKVFAVASILSHVHANFYECLRKQGVVVVTANAPLSSRFFREFAGAVYGPTNPSYTRMLGESVDALWADGWLTSSSKVGVVGFDTPDGRATVTDGLVPALKRRGLNLEGEFYTNADNSAAGSYSGGVLKFKADGVDRVFFAPGGQPIYFALAAEQQNYRPRYELSTLEYPGPIAAILPAEQLKGSAGLGWSPYLDLDNRSAEKVGTPGKAECIEAVRGANQNLTTGTTLAIATWICDDWFFLRDAFARSSGVDRTSFRAAAEGLGRSYRGASTFQTYFAPGRTSDGAAAYRLNKFNEQCSCFQYAGPLRQMR